MPFPFAFGRQGAERDGASGVESASLNILTYRAKCIKYTAKTLCDATFRLRPPFLTF